MRDDRQVKFNVTIAKYMHGQVVNYADMPPGHQLWVNDKCILESTRICEFVEDEKIVEVEPVLDPKNHVPTDPPDVEEDKVEPVVNDTESTVEPKATNGLTFDFDKKDEVSKPLCPGKNKDGSPCKRDKLSANGYCFQHQDQAPTGNEAETERESKPNPITWQHDNGKSV